MSMAGQVWPYRGVLPTLDASAFIALGTHVIGDVRIGAQSSIWRHDILLLSVATQHQRLAARDRILVF